MYGLTSSSNTHMAKNTEWGAVVYLSQSKYGRMSNSNNEVYINNSHYSERSAGSATGIVEGEGYGSYSYNNKSCTSEICDGDITLNAGTGASTTGNIYGIYDMNGGSSEKVMANWNNNSASSGFNNLPEGKYYDKYIIENPGDNSIIKEKSILGDATWETVNWYSDSGTFYNEDNPWIDRGGSSSNSNNSNIGIYQFNCNSGQSTVDNIYTTYRTVLIP